MTQSPNPNNRRRRLTADELIAVLVAMSGIGAIFWWSVSHRPQGWNFAATNSNVNAANKNTAQVFPLTNNSNNSKAAPSIGPRVAASAALPTVAGSEGTVQTSVAPSSDPTVPTVMTPSVTYENAPSPATSFSDVPEKYWAKNNISVLQEMGVLKDFGNGAFDPNLPITRGEYAKMLDRAFGADKVVSQQVLEFKDIPANYVRKEALDKSVKMGFMTGYSKTQFKPDENIPRYQMQISLAKGMNLKAPAGIDAVLDKFGDANSVPAWAKSKMAAAIESGLVLKDNNATQLQPTKATTRGEAAALIYEALVKAGKIKPIK
jgi:S-layer homology domain